MSNKLQANGKISPFSFPEGTANCLLMLHQALALLPNTWTQSPHWNHNPNPTELAAEQEYLDEAKEADKEVKRLAKEIYKSLTGHAILQHEDVG